jgi:hypothetical protein
LARPFSPHSFGKYFLAERLAAGGMAEVYRAILKGAAGFEKVVALKRILPFFGSDPDFVTLFQDEARIASTLTHANIAQVFEFGEVDGSFYLTMELVDGIDLSGLSDRLRKEGQPMPLATAAFIVAEAARGLSYAHDKKGQSGKPLDIVHRDVSPHNVLVSYAGEVKVTDFGIAKATGKAHKTATGVVMGKLRYMSPEQVAGEELDPRSDVFSLGVILYELLTGGPIFPGDQSLRLAELIHTGTIPPPSTRNGSVPPALDEIVLKALSRPREGRFARASDLARELTVLVNQTAPGFTREDLGALVQRVAPPRSGASSTGDEVPATERHKGLAHAPTVTPGHVALAAGGEGGPAPFTEMAPQPAVGPPPVTVPRLEAVAERTNDPVETATGAGRGGRKRRLSTEMWIAVGLVVVIIVSGIVVLTRFTSPSKKAAVVSDAGVAGTGIDAGVVIARVDAGAVGPAPFVLTPTATTPDERRRLEAAVNAELVTRRGVPMPDYHAYLTAVDARIAGLTLAADGTAGAPGELPAAAAAELQRWRVEQAVDATVEYVRATGDLPPNVKAGLKRLLSGRPSASAETTIQGVTRLPPWSASGLAVWLSPGDSTRLAELAYANDLQGRWCETPAPPQRHFAPHLCERAALIAALRAIDSSDPAATALELSEEATPLGSKAQLSDGGTVLVKQVKYELDVAADRYVVHVTVELTGPSLPNAMLRGGWIATPIEPAGIHDAGGIDAGEMVRVFTFTAPRRFFAPVLLIGSATVRLMPPPWGP